jgi:hypothetical protein
LCEDIWQAIQYGGTVGQDVAQEKEPHIYRDVIVHMITKNFCPNFSEQSQDPRPLQQMDYSSWIEQMGYEMIWLRLLSTIMANMDIKLSLLPHQGFVVCETSC